MCWPPRGGCSSIALRWVLAISLALLADAQPPLLRIAGSSTVLPIAEYWSNMLRANYSFTDTTGAYDTCTLAAGHGHGQVASSTICGGGDAAGASRLCSSRTSRTHIDIGLMTRSFIQAPAPGAEAIQLDDGYTYECTGTKVRATQMTVGIDGLAIVTGKSGSASSCLLAMGGLTLAQLRWIYSDWTDAQLASDKDGGLDMQSVAPNNNNNGIKEWSDFDHTCDQKPINPYGAGALSANAPFFAQGALCKACYNGDAGHAPEDYNNCASAANSQLDGATTAGNTATWKAAIHDAAQRPPNCVMSSNDDANIVNWLAEDPSGIGYLSYAYYGSNAASLTLGRVASDVTQGIATTKEAVVQPDSYTITDGSYSIFRRELYMSVDVASWGLAKAFLDYGYSETGTGQVTSAGFVAVNAARRASSLVIVNAGGNPTADYRDVVPSTCPIGNELMSTPYVSQFGMPKVNYACTPCKKGYAKRDTAAAACVICDKGTFASNLGQDICGFCQPGEFSSYGAASCNKCPKNTVTAMPGLSQCTACDEGFVTPAEGGVMCDRCDFGTYRSKDVNDLDCHPCPDGMTTAIQGSSSKTDCKCATGSYLAPGAGEDGPCLPCPDGMTCAFGSQYDDIALYSAGNTSVVVPQVLAGYWTSPAAPLDVFKCRVALSPCPGGAPGQCNGGREGLVCAVCPPSYSFTKNECKPCGKAWSAMVVFGPIVVTILVILTYYLTNSPLTSNVSVTSALAMVVSMILTVLQLLSMFNDMSVQWPRDIRMLFDAVSLTMGTPATMRHECILGNNPVVLYGFRCLIPLGLFADVIILFVLSKLLGCIRTSFRSWDTDKTINTGAQILQAVFIGFAAIMVVPLQCFKHPNGKKSLNYYPNILCWEHGDHGKLLGFGFAVAALFVLPFVAFCIIGTYSVVSPKTINTMRYRFLLFRFRPDVWWWSNVFMARQLALVFAPSLPAETPHAQAIYVISILVTYGLSQAHYWPWKTPEFNVLDIATTAGLILIITVSTTLLEPPDDKEKVMYAGVLLTLVIILAIAAGYILLSVFYYGCKHRPFSGSASFGHRGVHQGKVAEQFFALCCMVKELGYENCKATLVDMNYYDRGALRTCISGYQACNRATCPSGQLSKPRLVGVPRSDSSTSVSTSGSGRMSDKWKEKDPHVVRVNTDDEPVKCAECGKSVQSTVMV